jgi:hypothetical protein
MHFTLSTMGKCFEKILSLFFSTFPIYVCHRVEKEKEYLLYLENHFNINLKLDYLPYI